MKRSVDHARRHWLTALAGGLLSACTPRPAVPVSLRRPGMLAGHQLREQPRRGRAGGATLRCEVAILGSGTAAQAAAWQLARGGLRDVLIVSGPETFGNAAGRVLGGLPCPSGAHYLPLPSPEALPVREMLAELGVLIGPPSAAQPEYDERVLVHAPQERLLWRGQWVGTLQPLRDDADAARFFALVETLKQARGTDGRRAFAIPLSQASQDSAWRALDTQSFAAWLAAQAYRSPALLSHLDYCCRDDYGAGLAVVSAYAGLHYFAARNGQARNAESGSVLSWPNGLHSLLAGLQHSTLKRMPTLRQLQGHVRWVEEGRHAVSAEVALAAGGTLHLHARHAISAMPLHVARHVMPLEDYAADLSRLPQQAPWLVGNFLLRRFPRELADASLAWDNVVAGSAGLGYVLATHQLIRAAKPARTVFTSYRALAADTPEAGRQQLLKAGDAALLALAAEDLHSAYGEALWDCVEAVELSLRGHAMAIPSPGYLGNATLAALRGVDGALRFAHSDLCGYSIFEEAACLGVAAAEGVLGGS